MDYKEIIDKTKSEIENTLDYFKGQLLEIRQGRISPSLVENVKVDCFGSVLPIKQLGVVTVSSPKGLTIQLWDKSYVDGVIKGIQERNFGLGIKIEGNTIYLTNPTLTEETKKNLIKVLNEKKEDIFQTMRHIRDKAWKEIQDGFQNGEIREDDKYKGKEKLDKTVKEYKEKIEEMVKNKEREILE